MLKYLYHKEVFSEIPGEISLGISISGCQIHCQGCHSRDLWEDKGIPLTTECLEHLLKAHKGISCLLLMGGEHDIDSLIELFKFAKSYYLFGTTIDTSHPIRTAWYCGLDNIPKNKRGILKYLDYCKLGHYDMELGGLDYPTTNQRLYEYNRFFSDCTVPLGIGWRDITFKFRPHATNKIQG